MIGTRVEAKAVGKGLEKEGVLAWSSSPHVVVLGGDKPMKFFLSIAKEAVPGPCLVRLYNESDASPPRIVEVGKYEELTEKEPNDTLADARQSAAKMNVTFNGVLEKAGDVDTYAIQAKQGKNMRLELHGYALGSPMDPAMRLLNDKGVEIAAGHDTHNLDPRIEYTPAADATLYVQLFSFAHPPAADVSFKGSANHVYRLTVTDEPKPAVAANELKTLTLPATVNGCISKNGEEDTYTFNAKKGDDLQLRVRAQSLHNSELDAALRIEDSAGKVLQQADDSDKEVLDPTLRWKAPGDGEYKLVVADRFHHGSAEHGYELTVAPFKPSLTATLDTHAYRLEAGKSVEVKLTVKPSGIYTGKIKAQAVNLPAGVTAESVDIPAKGGEVKLTLKATPEAVASQAPFAVEITTSARDAVETLKATYAIPFTEPRGDLLIMTDDHPWLTLVAKKP
ncbi:pre-peptidase C-terminal domain-containing protein [Prosthecobacter fluviatilis]|uniref:Pre-peptidase C-terminal domain-containing protein n=1 Tax=Prosthecobacter fluviatilis TaxID=445931 RepID=A0ABW0KWU6_9BACT